MSHGSGDLLWAAENSESVVRRVWYALPISGIVVAGVGAYVAGWRFAIGAVAVAGEQIQITLADGSHVWLGPKSKVAVHFTRAERGLHGAVARLAGREALRSRRRLGSGYSWSSEASL